MKGSQIKRILIVGGGTSGWITACILSKHLDDVEVTLVESSDIPTIGVGEATIIHLNDFLHAMDLKEEKWMPYCNATYKEGIYFRDFYQKGAQYWHPFQHISPELTDFWIGHVPGIDQLSIAHDLGKDLLQRFIVGDGPGQIAALQAREFALEAGP